MLNTKRSPLYRLLRTLQPSETSTLLVLALTVGLGTGVGIWLFRVAIGLFHAIFVDELNSLIGNVLGKLTLVVGLAAAGLIVGWLIERYVGDERHHGVAGIMEAVALAGGRLRYEKLPAKAIASALSLGAGASVGPEDPSVQIGANLGSMVGQRLRLNEDRVRLLVAAGSASAIAAVFNAPIAGVFFSLEVVLLEITTNAFGVVVLSAVVASVVIQALEQVTALHEATLQLRNYSLGSPLELPLYGVLGLLLAIPAALFIRSIYWQHDAWHHRVHLPRPVGTALVGVVVALVGIFLPQILGAGREVMNEVLSEPTHFTVLLLLLIGVAKIVMTGFSLAGGFVGGVFAPTLFIGLIFGGAFGRVIEGLGWSMTSGSQAYAIVGMAAMMAGVVRSPITAIMLVFELTNDYRLILPMMFATVVCMFLTNRLAPLGIYMMGLARQEIHLHEGHDIDLMQGITVAEVMDPPRTIVEDASLVDLRDHLRKLHVRSLAVVNKEQRLVGIVTLSDLQQAYEYQPEEASHLTVGSICTRGVVTCHPDDVLWRAIRLMGANDVGRIPVVDDHSGELVGIVSRHDIIDAYNKAIAHKLQDQHHAEQVRLSHLTGAHVMEVYIKDSAPIANKPIQEIHWPPEAVVASIQRHNKLLVPHGGTQLQPGDWVTLVAAPECEDELSLLFGERPVAV